MGYMKNLGVQKMLGSGPGGKTLKVTAWFFDAPAVLKAVDTGTIKVLSKFGAFVRRTMKSSIRKRKRYSNPGDPPSSHVGLLKDFIFFSFDPQNRSVVIGPEKLNAKIGSTPEALEYGGSNVIATYRKRKVVSKHTVNIKARPYARPALEKELPKLPEMWRNSVKSKT